MVVVSGGKWPLCCCMLHTAYCWYLPAQSSDCSRQRRTISFSDQTQRRVTILNQHWRTHGAIRVKAGACDIKIRKFETRLTDSYTQTC